MAEASSAQVVSSSTLRESERPAKLRTSRLRKRFPLPPLLALFDFESSLTLSQAPMAARLDYLRALNRGAVTGSRGKFTGATSRSPRLCPALPGSLATGPGPPRPAPRPPFRTERTPAPSPQRPAPGALYSGRSTRPLPEAMLRPQKQSSCCLLHEKGKLPRQLQAVAVRHPDQLREPNAGEIGEAITNACKRLEQQLRDLVVVQAHLGKRKENLSKPCVLASLRPLVTPRQPRGRRLCPAAPPTQSESQADKSGQVVRALKCLRLQASDPVDSCMMLVAMHSVHAQRMSLQHKKKLPSLRGRFARRMPRLTRRRSDPWLPLPTVTLDPKQRSRDAIS